jgi:hypothetical protein
MHRHVHDAGLLALEIVDAVDRTLGGQEMPLTAFE